MATTYNKDGKPRKIGSGKTKGAGCYEEITMRELQKLIPADDKVIVGRVWLSLARERNSSTNNTSYLATPPKKTSKEINKIENGQTKLPFDEKKTFPQKSFSSTRKSKPLPLPKRLSNKKHTPAKKTYIPPPP